MAVSVGAAAMYLPFVMGCSSFFTGKALLTAANNHQRPGGEAQGQRSNHGDRRIKTIISGQESTTYDRDGV
jgi:hypothetical protein